MRNDPQEHRGDAVTSSAASVALGDVCDVIGGGTPAKDRAEFYGGYIPWATVRDMRSELIVNTEFKITPLAVERSSTNIIPKGNVVIATRVGLGKVCLLQQDTAINQDLRAIVPKNSKQLSVLYLFWWLKSAAHLIAAEGTGATVQGVKLPFIKSLVIPLPTLSEQQRIVAILDEACAGLAIAAANAERNLKNARELFESYLNSVFRRKGGSWTEKALGDVCRFQGGSQPPKAKFSSVHKDGYVRLIQIRDYKSDKFAVYISKSLTKKFCGADDVMIGRYGPPLFQILRGLEGAYNVALMKAMPDERMLSKDFLFYFLKNNDILSYIIRSSSRAAGQSGLNKETIEPYRIAFPSLSEQAEVVELLRRRENECERLESNYERKLESLSNLKHSLLQKAFSGELTSPPSQAIKEAAE